jgi:hypothetical protein
VGVVGGGAAEVLAPWPKGHPPCFTGVPSGPPSIAAIVVAVVLLSPSGV